MHSFFMNPLNGNNKIYFSTLADINKKSLNYSQKVEIMSEICSAL